MAFKSSSRIRVVLDEGLNPDSHFARARWWLYRPCPQGKRLSSTARDVYCWCVAWYGTNKEGVAFADSIYPRQKTIAEDLGLSLRTVERAMAELMAWYELVEVVDRPPLTKGKNRGLDGVNHYRFYTGPYPPWDRKGELPLPWTKGRKIDPFAAAEVAA